MVRWDDFNDVVLGMGRLKRAELARRKSAEKIERMRRIKRVFDPQGIMNPGKVV